LLREGKPLSVEVTLANRDVMLAQATGRPRRDAVGSDDSTSDDPKVASASIGITVRELSQRERETLGTKIKGGVVVTQVDDGSPADLAGISEGEIIIEAGGHDIGAPADLSTVVRQTKGQTRSYMRLLVADVDWSSGASQPRYVAVKIKE
jgi:predicted metalloprotease with PDZ domain